MLAVWVVFGQTAGFKFVNYDDDENVFENAVVEKGLSVEGLAGPLPTRKSPIGFRSPLFPTCWIASSLGCTPAGITWSMSFGTPPTRSCCFWCCGK